MFALGQHMTARQWILASAVVSLAAWPIGRRRPHERPPQPRYTEIYSSDSLDLRAPALSPDGKWVVFESRHQQDEKVALFIISASGGKPRALTSGNWIDGWPVWFPESDRILFRSTRVDGALMTLKIDDRTGAAVGEPQRLTIEPVQEHGGYSVSADGKEVLYPVNSNGQSTLKLIPANGGTARVVASVPGVAIPQSYWTPDGSIEFSVADARGQYFDVMRADGGGGARLIHRNPLSTGISWAGPDYLVRGAYVRINADTVGTLSVVSHAGDTLARFDSRGATPPVNLRMRMGARSGTFMLATGRSREAIRAMSAAGGEPWTVRPARTGYYQNAEYPEGFTTDSRNLQVSARNGDSSRMLIVPVRGGAATRSVTLPPRTWGAGLSAAGHYIYTWDGHPRDSTHVVQSVDITTGRTELVSRAATGLRVPEPDPKSDDLYYIEVKPTRLELRRFIPGHGSTLIRSYGRGQNRVSQEASLAAMAWARNAKDSGYVYIDTGNDQPKEILAIHGTVRRVAWSPSGRSLAINVRTTMRGDTVGILYVASFGDGGQMTAGPREVAATPGSVQDVRWSPTSNTLACELHIVRSADSSLAAAYVHVNESTATFERARVVDLPNAASENTYGIYWTPDGRTSFVHVADKAGWRMQLWRVDNEPNAKPINISRETASYWDVAVSPDGKTLVYQADLPFHSTIWRVDIPGLGTADGR